VQVWGGNSVGDAGARWEGAC